VSEPKTPTERSQTVSCKDGSYHSFLCALVMYSECLVRIYTVYTVNKLYEEGANLFMLS